MKKIKIVFTGGSGRFGSIFRKNVSKKYNLLFPTKKQLNITRLKSIENYLKKNKPKYFIHCAALSRPMDIHKKKINLSIDTNIIGTSNVVKCCSNNKIKLIYFSTNYVYPFKKGKYNEKSPVLPVNNYAWSKLGGECAVQMYDNSLILRVCMTEKPFLHKKAYSNLITNFMFHEDLAKRFLKLINYKGVLNVGGDPKSVYNFVKKNNPYIKKTVYKINSKNLLPKNSVMSVNKFKKIIKK